MSRGVDADTAWRLLERFGISEAAYADPETRVSHQTAVELMKVLVASEGETVGLRAGKLVQPGDFDVVERAVAACPTIREACACYARYARLMNSAVDVSVRDEEDAVILEYRITDGVEHPPAATDFFMASLVTFTRQQTGRDDPSGEVHLTHGPTSYQDAYAAFFRSRVVFNAPTNAIVSPRFAFDTPMRWSNPNARRVFELRAHELLLRLERNDTIGGRVGDLVESAMRESPSRLSMTHVARKLAMSVPTLRRRLALEGRSYSAILDDTRRGLALSHLGDSALSVAEIAFLLGFADLPSFHRAFKRWMGASPSEFRAQRRGRGSEAAALAGT
jgi:AraC-like DNA-binding protein